MHEPSTDYGTGSIWTIPHILKMRGWRPKAAATPHPHDPDFSYIHYRYVLSMACTVLYAVHGICTAYTQLMGHTWRMYEMCLVEYFIKAMPTSFCEGNYCDALDMAMAVPMTIAVAMACAWPQPRPCHVQGSWSTFHGYCHCHGHADICC